VQTGRIVQVVSEDIKGELEEVVGRLPGIAARLVGQTAPPPPPPPPKKSEPVVETPKAEPQPVTPAVAPVAGPVAVLNGEKEDRNRNRGGLRISYSMFPGTLKSSAKTSSLSLSDYIQSDSAAQFYNAQSFGPSITNNFALLFFIKAGKFINISIGPSFLYNSQEITSYDNATLATSDLTRTITVTAIEPGVNFVKRIYPLKINAGLFVDFNMLTFNNDYSSTSSLGVSDNWTDFDMGFGIGGGARGGVEIMLGKHVGLNAELVYRFATFSTIESSKFSLEYSVTPQMLGFGFGANFYF